MKGRPSRLTQECLSIFTEQAILRKQVLTLKEIAVLTGYGPTYCQQIMARIQKGEKITVPRGTSKADESMVEVKGMM